MDDRPDADDSRDALTHETASKAYRVDEQTREPDLSEEFFGDKVVLRSLADDLADVWRDLRNGLDALERGAPEDEVTWEWRFGFRTHWGAQAVEALRALHQQLTDRQTASAARVHRSARSNTDHAAGALADVLAVTLGVTAGAERPRSTTSHGTRRRAEVLHRQRRTTQRSSTPVNPRYAPLYWR